MNKGPKKVQKLVMKRIHLPSQLQIRSSLTPHDVSVLILIYYHCFTELVIPPKVFVKVISPSIPSLEINPILKKSLPNYASHKPLIPTLGPLIDYLLRLDERKIALKVISFLQSMESLDVFTQLLKVLNENCLVKTYRSQSSIGGASNRRITKTSFIGIYLVRCLTKYQIGDFKDKEALWESFSQYLSDFKQTSTWFSIETEVKEIEFDFMPKGNPRSEDREMISLFRQLSNDIYSSNASTLMIDNTYFQSILNWQIYDIAQKNGTVDPAVMDITKKLSSSDMTQFPALHIIRYLLAVQANCYQDALDALHNYFDYMLTQNEESCFHISLLCLATFHMCFHDCPAAIKAFEEATKIARENKDSATLNLIMIWVVDFIEIYPEYANHFQVTVDQIVRYLKSCSDNENSLVFENAYRFESLLLMMDNSSSISYLESVMKYIVIALQRLQSGSNIAPAFKYSATLWNYLGFTSVSKVYQVASMSNLSSMDYDIRRAFDALEAANYDEVSSSLMKLKSPRLNNEQFKMLKLLEIKFYIAMKDYKTSMRKVNERLNESNECVSDARWKFQFQIQKCIIFLSSSLAMRSIPLLKDMINDSELSKNCFHTAQALLLLCQVLLSIGKAGECKKLLSSNLPTLLQFPQLEDKVVELFNVLTI